jgi:hypothetical protein
MNWLDLCEVALFEAVCCDSPHLEVAGECCVSFFAVLLASLRILATSESMRCHMLLVDTSPQLR